MEKIQKFDKTKFIVILAIVLVLVLTYLFIVISNYYKVKSYDNKVLPNSYLGEFTLGDYSYDKLDKQLDFYDSILSERKITIHCNDKEYQYTYKQLGLSLDHKKIIDNIKDYQSKQSYGDKLFSLNSKTHKKVYFYVLEVNEDVLRSFLNDLKGSVDTPLVNGYFDTSTGNVRYIEGVDSYQLNIEESISSIKNIVTKKFDHDSELDLKGDIVKSVTNESYKTIDTKVSSFYTEFNASLYARVANLRTALGYINGAIVEPGEVFSFYRYAGPYNKKGYQFYYEFVGNGVCQIATTTYNAALLGGLEIVKRYPHAAKSPYVAGGLDATVASYSSGWNVDFQFKNTYSYPIYISAYMVGNKAYVEFWSNSEAKGGKTYSTESVQIGARGYTTYLYTYQNGVQISRDKITTTWYTED